MDDISEERLAEVHPELSRRIHRLAEALSFPIRVTRGLRTYAQQAELYAQGRTAPGEIVTKAKPGESMHNFGLAVDVVPMIDGKPDWNDKDRQWEEILMKAKCFKLAEGATWRTFPDNPHLYPKELSPDPDDNMRYLFAEAGIRGVWQDLKLNTLEGG